MKITNVGTAIIFMRDVLNPPLDEETYSSTSMDDATKIRIRQYLNNYVNNIQQD